MKTSNVNSKLSVKKSTVSNLNTIVFSIIMTGGCGATQFIMTGGCGATQF
jgi:hypothetical protein